MGVPKSKKPITAPDYQLTRYDDNFFKYSLGSRKGTFETIMVSIAPQKVVFVASKFAAPKAGQRIGVEFNVPGGGRVAGWVDISTIDKNIYEGHGIPGLTDEKSKVMITGYFHKLDPRQATMIKKNTASRRKELRSQYTNSDFDKVNAWLAENFWKTLFVMGAILAVYYVIAMFNNPARQFEKKETTPWGQKMRKVLPRRSN